MNTPLTAVLLSLLGTAPAGSSDSLCAKREPCRIVETLDAGQNEQGHPLQIQRVSLGWTDLETGAQFEGNKFGPGTRKAEGAAAEGQCEATEWWLVRANKPAQLLLSVCDDHQGAVHEETVVVGKNRLQYTQSGERRDDRWSNTRTLRLSPLRLSSNTERTTWDSPSTGQPKVDSTQWDLELLRGEVIRAPSECQPGETSLGERTLPYLPQVQVDKSYLEGGWKQVGLGTAEGGCNLEAKHVLLGQEQLSGPEDAGLKAVLVADDTLLVEVLDDTWTGPSARWLNDDHVELWLAPLPPQQLNGCGGKLTKDQKPVQWGIRIVDGQVFPAFGAPKQTLQVERAELPGAKGYRLKIKLPMPFLGISVVYSDSDGGKKQEAMKATSPLKFGRPETFNPVYLVYPQEGSCTVKDGKLAVVRPELKAEPDKAVLQRE